MQHPGTPAGIALRSRSHHRRLKDREAWNINDLTVAAAKSADVAIVFAYQWESEAVDLLPLDLSPDQNRLVEAVAAANPETIVVPETGSPATMPWIV